MKFALKAVVGLLFLHCAFVAAQPSPEEIQQLCEKLQQSAPSELVQVIEKVDKDTLQCAIGGVLRKSGKRELMPALLFGGVGQEWHRSFDPVIKQLRETVQTYMPELAPTFKTSIVTIGNDTWDSYFPPLDVARDYDNPDMRTGYSHHVINTLIPAGFKRAGCDKDCFIAVLIPFAGNLFLYSFLEGRIPHVHSAVFLDAPLGGVCVVPSAQPNATGLLRLYLDFQNIARQKAIEYYFRRGWFLTSAINFFANFVSTSPDEISEQVTPKMYEEFMARNYVLGTIWEDRNRWSDHLANNLFLPRYNNQLYVNPNYQKRLTSLASVHLINAPNNYIAPSSWPAYERIGLKEMRDQGKLTVQEYPFSEQAFGYHHPQALKAIARSYLAAQIVWLRTA